MRKLIASINMTLDGFCDHTSGTAGEELHRYYTDLLRGADGILFGRVTYHLMEYWKTVAEAPTGNPATDEFATAIEAIPKTVFSRTLKNVDWKNVTLAERSLEEEVWDLKQQSGRDILVGSPSLIVGLTKLGLIDEYRLCVHPLIAGSGLPLFKDIHDMIVLRLLGVKAFGSGHVVLSYASGSLEGA